MILRVDNLNEQAYDILRKKILSKELLPGTRLVDSQLAEEFGISRTPMRDAIRKLAEEGLVVNNPQKKGYYVYQPSAKDINEIFELRLFLDLAAATKLITETFRKDPEAFLQLQAFYRAEHENNDTPFIQKDEDFHDIIIQLCHNSRMTAIYSDLRSQTRAFRSITSRDKERIDKAQNFHGMIYTGFLNMDLEATLSAIRKHVEYSREDAIKDYISAQPEAEETARYLG